MMPWRADNPSSRDFRYVYGIRYGGTSVTLTMPRTVEVALPQPVNGWSAAFVEATFRDGLVATPPVYISPDDRYPMIVPSARGAACQTLPGRGLGTLAARVAS